MVKYYEYYCTYPVAINWDKLYVHNIHQIIKFPNAVYILYS